MPHAMHRRPTCVLHCPCMAAGKSSLEGTSALSLSPTLTVLRRPALFLEKSVMAMQRPKHAHAMHCRQL